MTMENYIDYAKSFGYDLQFTGIGMAYIKLNDLYLTDCMDFEKAQYELALIGMAIMNDTIRAEVPAWGTLNH